MANEINSKVLSQLVDLNRSLDKLTLEVKKNTDATKENSQPEGENTNNVDLKSISESLKGLSDLKDIGKDLKKLNFGDLSETLSKFPKSIESIVKGPVLNPGSIIGSITQKSQIPFDLNKIIGAFAEGGIAKKEGNYLVGEGGPEVVKLPAGSAVIPLDSKELIEGLSEIPEIAKSIKSGEVNLYGERDNPGLVLGTVEDIKNRISLYKLSQKYEDELFEQESLPEDQKNPEILKKLEKQNSIIEKLIDYSERRIGDELSRIKSEENDFRKNNFPAGLSQEDIKSFQKTWDSIINSLPSGEVNDLTIAKGSLLAAKMLLNQRIEKKEGQGKPEDLEDLKEKTGKNPDEINRKKAEEAKSLVQTQPSVLSKKTTLDQLIETPSEGLGKKIIGGLGEAIKSVAPETSFFGKIGKSALSEGGQKLISRITPGIDNFSSGLRMSQNISSLLGPEYKKMPTGLLNLPPKSRTPDLSLDLKNLSNEISGFTKSVMAGPAGGGSEPKISPSGEGIEKVSEGPKQNAPLTDIKGMNLNDGIEQIKGLLSRIAVSLEGPLEVTALDSPFRPNSRKI